MDAQIDRLGRFSTWVLRIAVSGGAVAGAALLVMAAATEGAPGWWWAAGEPLALSCGSLATIWISFRLRHRSPAEREAAFDQMRTRQAELDLLLERSTLAHRATRCKRAVLRSGVAGTAVVTFLADGRRAKRVPAAVVSGAGRDRAGPRHLSGAHR